MSSSMVVESVLTEPLIAALVVAEVEEDSVADKVATRAVTRAVTSRAARAAARVDTAADRVDTAVVVSSSPWNWYIRIANITRTNRILESQQFCLKFVSRCLKCLIHRTLCYITWTDRRQT